MLLGISRSGYYYESVSEQDEKDLHLLMRIKEVQLKRPELGYRKIWRELNKHVFSQYKIQQKSIKNPTFHQPEIQHNVILKKTRAEASCSG